MSWVPLYKKKGMQNDGKEGRTWLPSFDFFPSSYLFCLYLKMFVDKSVIALAYNADLYDYLCRVHRDSFKKTANNLYLRSNNSLVIHRGNYGYIDYATRETGNGIDFLMRHLGYSFQEAVVALTMGITATAVSSAESTEQPNQIDFRAIRLPAAAPFPHSRMYAFLMKRKIPKTMIDSLVQQGLIYQESRTNNIVFVNPERDYFELRGTFTFAEKPFHGCGKAKPDRFWYFKGGYGTCDIVYITEAAIDAVSLFLLHRKRGVSTANAVYVSIGGVSNYATIERIRTKRHAVLAVDNDPAGQRCRARYKDLDYILPVHKDWNEDLCKI